MDEQRQVLWSRVYSASARMLWAQSTQAWWGEGWPEERKLAWQHLETVLAEHNEVSSEPGAASNPTRHLLMQRSADDRPILLAEAARKWRESILSAQPVRHPKFLIEEHPELRGVGPSFYPGECLLLHHNWWAMTLAILRDLDHRIAPGRPGYTVGEDARELSDLVHRVADGLRTPFTRTSTPHPGEHPWIDTALSDPCPVSEAELDRLCTAAQNASLQTPSRTERRENRDLSVSATSSDAAASLLRILSGTPEEPWVEVAPEINPGHHLANSRAVVRLSVQAAEWEPRLFAQEVPAPYTPTEPEYARPAGQSPWRAVSREAALVLADIMDEFSVRITPGRTTSRMRFESFPASAFCRDFQGHVADI